MSLYALDEASEAIDETKDLLLPFNFKMWAKLALIVFMTGSGFNMPSGYGNYNQPVYNNSYDDFNSDYGSMNVPESSLGFMAQQDSIEDLSSLDSKLSSSALAGAFSSAAVTAILAVILFVVLLFAFLGSIFEFVYFQSLIDREVKIRHNFSKHFWKGVRYFGFRIGYALILLALIGIGALAYMNSPVLIIPMILLAIPLFIVLGIFNGLTHDFVLLKMIESDKSLIASWKEFWGDLKGEWKQVIAYVIVKFFLGLIIGIMSVIVGLIVLLVMLIPVLIVSIPLFIVSPILGAIPLIIGIILLFAAMLFVAVPFRTYLYYYFILVYHDLTS